jgi:hypothetical protein
MVAELAGEFGAELVRAVRAGLARQDSPGCGVRGPSRLSWCDFATEYARAHWPGRVAKTWDEVGDGLTAITMAMCEQVLRPCPAALGVREDVLRATPLARRPYDLRHLALSPWLCEGADPAEIVQRAGNSVEVPRSRYAKCLYDRQSLNNHRIEHLLRSYDQPPENPDTEESRSLEGEA